MKHSPLHGHIHSFSCSTVYEHLCEHLDEDLNSESCRRIKAHIEGCVNCSALLDSLKKTVYGYRKYPCPRISKESREKLLAVIRLEKRKKDPRR